MHDNDKQSNAFWAWAKCLGGLIFWAMEPDAETTTTDGWLEAVRSDIRDNGDLARDAAPDDVTRKQVIRSRSLALDLVRRLNHVPELNRTSCRNWSLVDQKIVTSLADLQERFAKLGDGEQREARELRDSQLLLALQAQSKTEVLTPPGVSWDDVWIKTSKLAKLIPCDSTGLGRYLKSTTVRRTGSAKGSGGFRWNCEDLRSVVPDKLGESGLKRLKMYVESELKAVDSAT